MSLKIISSGGIWLLQGIKGFVTIIFQLSSNMQIFFSGCSKSSESSYVVKQHIDELDYQINSLLATIPQAITEAR